MFQYFHCSTVTIFFIKNNNEIQKIIKPFNIGTNKNKQIQKICSCQNNPKIKIFVINNIKIIHITKIAKHDNLYKKKLKKYFLKYCL